ncbi:MAG: 2-amino-4-hydroxy-6-hydroxymethyldihydropteridine diphosphokinase [Chitinophagaceae bacterium]|jgi:2-amino-4-hydroxy-6-hydroxymethyldihydropteridine diphosphokinase
MKAAYLVMGGNFGDRLGFMAAAKEKIQQSGIEILRQSSVYETAARGIIDQSSYLLLITAFQLKNKNFAFGLAVLSLMK